MQSRHLFTRTLLAAAALRKAADREAIATTGLTSAQLGVLLAIAGAPGCRQRHVADVLGVRESAVTALLMRIRAHDLIRRVRTDGRSFGLHLTETGHELVGVARAHVSAVEASLAEGFDDTELEVISRYLDTTHVRFGGDP